MTQTVAAKAESTEESEPMAIMSTKQITAAECAAAIRALKPATLFLRAEIASYLKTIHDRKLYQDIGFKTWEDCAVHLIGNRRTADDLLEQLATFGPTMMKLLDQAQLSRKVRRVLSHSDQKDLLELKKFLQDEKDPELIHDAAIDIYNRLVAAEAEALAAKEKAKDAALDLGARKQALNESEEKRRKLEKDLAQAEAHYGADPARDELFGRCLRALGAYQVFVESAGVKTSDAKPFKRSIDQLRTMIDNVWRTFIEPPKGTKSKEDWKRVLMKEKGFTEAQAEEILDGYDLT